MGAHRATQMEMVRTQTFCSVKYCDSMSTLLILTQFQRIIHLEMKSGLMVCAIPGVSRSTAQQVISILVMSVKICGRRLTFFPKVLLVVPILAGVSVKAHMITKAVDQKV